MTIPLPPPIVVPEAYPLHPVVPLAQPTYIPLLEPPGMPGVVDTSKPVPTPNLGPIAEPDQEALEQIEALQEWEREQERQRERAEEEAKAEREQEQEESSGNPEESEVEQSPASSAEVVPPEELVPELAEVQTVEVFGLEIPVPRTEILATAATTAGVSSVVAVAGTLFATTLFRQLQPILKPIFKTILKKIAKVRKKPPPKTWARLRLESRQRRQDKTETKGGS
tara:strand:+ start:135 stop:809 length:675 start_codon:yes stop_codon:yes gene_type:complete